MRDNKKSGKDVSLRISQAARGKILSALITYLATRGVSESAFCDTIQAINLYIVNERFDPFHSSLVVDMWTWQIYSEMVDKAAARSLAARERARKRREMMRDEDKTPDRDGGILPPIVRHDSRPPIARRDNQPTSSSQRAATDSPSPEPDTQTTEAGKPKRRRRYTALRWEDTPHGRRYYAEKRAAGQT